MRKKLIFVRLTNELYEITSIVTYPRLKMHKTIGQQCKCTAGQKQTDTVENITSQARHVDILRDCVSGKRTESPED